MRRAIATVPGARTYLTGFPALAHDEQPIYSKDLSKGETIAVPIAIAVLLFMFGTLGGVLVPILFAGATLPTTLGLVWVIAHLGNTAQYVTNIVTLIGLAIAIDYSMLVVFRFREELAGGKDVQPALEKTMATAGRATLFSGSTVTIGLAALLFMPLPFMRSMGAGGVLIPLVSMAASVTLLPALLSVLGTRINGEVPEQKRTAPGTSRLARSLFSVRASSGRITSRIWKVRVIPRSVLERRARGAPGAWSRLAHFIMRRPVAVVVVTSALLLTLAVPAFGLHVTGGDNRSTPPGSEAADGLLLLEKRIGPGPLAPHQVVVDTGTPGGVTAPATVAAERRLVAQLRADPRIEASTIQAPVLSGQALARRANLIDPTGRALQIRAAGRTDAGTQTAVDLVRKIRNDYIPRAGFPASDRVYLTGAPAFGLDFVNKAYSAFKWLVIAVLVITYFVLLRAFRSVVLPIKAVLMNLLSISATYGALVLVFQHGWGEVVGFHSSPQIEAWIPIFLFAMLFGLSMDYEIFLLTRMREEWDRFHDNERAVAFGLERTGRIVTAAAVIMIAAFSGLMSGTFVGLQEFGFGLAIAILLDATIVRALLVPALMKLLGRWNWYMPERIRRTLRLHPEPQPVSST